MSITIEISPTTEEAIRDTAVKRGVTLEDVVRDLIEHAYTSISQRPPQADDRPFGLCAGQFHVPDDFNAPLPDEILDTFEGK